MRSMVMEFTEDKTCHYLDKQYMLGDSLLVAPIFNDQSMAEYYLPKGVWTDFFTGEVKNGGQWITEKHGGLVCRYGSCIQVRHDACFQSGEKPHDIDRFLVIDPGNPVG